LKAADLIYVRDAISYEYIKELRFPIEHVKMAPDITHLMERQPPDGILNGSKYACVIPNQKMFQMVSKEIGKSYVPFLEYCISYLIKNDISTFILLHDTHLDNKFISLLKPEFKDQVKIIKESDPLLLKGILGNSYIVIGSRYHSLVGALSQGVPSLGTGWSHKYHALFEDYSCPEYLVSPLDSFDKVSEKLDFLIHDPNRSILAKELMEKSEFHKKKVEIMWSEVREFLFP